MWFGYSFHALPIFVLRIPESWVPKLGKESKNKSFTPNVTLEF
jgi:hypothetical protein